MCIYWFIQHITSYVIILSPTLQVKSFQAQNKKSLDSTNTQGGEIISGFAHRHKINFIYG